MLLTSKWLKTLLSLIVAGICSALIVTCSIVLYLTPDLPEIEQLSDVQLQTPLRVYSADQLLIGEFGEKKRTPIEYEDIPNDFVNAFLAAEDDRFFSHYGVDPMGLLRAGSQIVTTGSIQSGGSTITMQVARNFFLSRKKTFTRKFNEILLSLEIERELDKKEIFELYANKIYLGKRSYGIEAAANVYYGKKITELSLAQKAMIAGLPKAPSAYNPIANPARALERRNWILGRMLKLDYISQADYDNAVSEAMNAKYHGSKIDLHAPYVAEMVRAEMLERFGPKAYESGYKVTTSINAQYQANANTAVKNGVFAYDKRHGYRGAEAAVDQATLSDSESLQTYLQNAGKVAGLIPVIVTDITDNQVTATKENLETITLEWGEGLAKVRTYVTKDRTKAPVSSAAELLSVGDLIRVYQDEKNRWQLTQIPKVQAAFIALNPKNGGIQALIGGFDYYYNRFNRATSAKRQPGSNIKPFVYATALENGFTASTRVNDAPIVFNDAQLEDIWRPENDSGKFYGPTSLRKALYLSRNLVSIRILRSLGISKARDGVMRFGFSKDDLAPNLTLTLGSQALEPMKIAAGYAAFANGGYQVTPWLIDTITDQDGAIIYQHDPATVCDAHCQRQAQALADENNANNMLDDIALNVLTPSLSPADLTQDAAATETTPKTFEDADNSMHYAEQILDPRVHFIIDSILKDVVKRGTATKAKVLKRTDIAGKTGTTNGPRDAWFSGYNPDITATAWVGFDDNSELGRREFGGTAALPIWIEFMQGALADKPEKFFPQPEGLVTAKVNKTTGNLAVANDTNAEFEYFLRENKPKTEQPSFIFEDANGEESQQGGAITDSIF